MRNVLALSLVLLVSPVRANEIPLGTITPTDAGAGANAVWNFTGLDAGFLIPPMALLSIQPDGGACVCIDSHINKSNKAVNCTCATGVQVPNGALFQTSCSTKSQFAKTTEYQLLGDGGIPTDGGLEDGGASARTAYTPPTCTVACVPNGAATVSCTVFQRFGNETP